MGQARKKAYADAEENLSILSVSAGLFSALKERPGLYPALGLLSVLPAAILQMVSISLNMDMDLAARFINMVFSALAGAAIASAVFQPFMEMGFFKALAQGFSSFRNLAILAILINILTFAGTLLLFVPGAIVACMCFVAVPVCVAEGLSPADSITRSISLSQGSWLKIFFFIVIYMLGIIFLPKAGIWAGKALKADTAIEVLIVNLFMILPNTFYGLASALVYADLRLIREGVSVEMLSTEID